jgi:DedD protein
MAKAQSTRSRKTATESGDGAVDPALPQKKRARHRLIGALALCAVAATVVPMLLEPEPTRSGPIAVIVPSRDPAASERAADARVEGGKRTAGPAASGEVRGTVSGATDTPMRDAAGESATGGRAKGRDARSADVAADSLSMDAPPDAPPGEGRAADRKAEGKTEGKADTKSDARAGVDGKSDPKADVRATPKKEADAKAREAVAAEARKANRTDDIERLAKGKTVTDAPSTTGRYALQVGAYSQASGAEAAAEKIRAAGVKAYTETIKTDKGNRIRVRAGPFSSREAAEEARNRLKAAGLDAAMIAP